MSPPTRRASLPYTPAMILPIAARPVLPILPIGGRGSDVVPGERCSVPWAPVARTPPGPRVTALLPGKDGGDRFEFSAGPPAVAGYVQIWFDDVAMQAQRPVAPDTE